AGLRPGTGPAPDPAALAGPAELAEAELAEAGRLGEPRYAANYHDLLAQLAAWRGDPAQAQAHLQEARRLYVGAGEPWHAARAEGQLARVALATGQAGAAEDLAREALGHGGALLPAGQAASLRSLLAEALGAQPGRETDLIDVALTAAAQWDGLSETDSVHQSFQAARAYGRLGRHAEAASLFAEVMPRVQVAYEPAVIAATFDQYGQSLQAAGRPWEAAGQFRRAAEVYAEVGDVVRRARCLRSAAWLDASAESMLAVLAELTQLEALAPDGEAGFLAGELTAARAQLDDLRAQLELDPAGPGRLPAGI
ncbi:MAG TPA: tetratricopeptide repeat protein, partial [Streptosporangiaceae bacterium]